MTMFSAIRKLLVDALMPGAIKAEHMRREVDYHWPLPVPHGCRCQERLRLKATAGKEGEDG